MPIKTLEQCRKILGVSAKEYTDEQLYKIRDFLYTIALLNTQYIKQNLKDEQTSNSLHESIDR